MITSLTSTPPINFHPQIPPYGTALEIAALDTDKEDNVDRVCSGKSWPSLFANFGTKSGASDSTRESKAPLSA
jgi:hypothetical protein